MNNWSKFNNAFHAGKSRETLLKIADTLDATSKAAALRAMGIVSAQDKKRISENKKAIASVSEAEIKRHCQFSGLFTEKAGYV